MKEKIEISGEVREQYDVGEEVVVMDRYSNRPEYIGKILGFSKDIIEVETRRGLFNRSFRSLVNRNQVQRIVRGKFATK